MLNGDMLEGGLVHFCWNEGSGGPCCEDRDDCVAKMVFAVSTALFGETDPLPAESRWTNLLMNMQKTVLRKCAANLGLEAFGFLGSSATGCPQTIEVDDAATESYYELVNKSRMQKAQEYFSDPRTIHELIVYSSILDVADSNLLYPLPPRRPA